MDPILETWAGDGSQEPFLQTGVAADERIELHPTLLQGAGYTSLEIKVDFLRPIPVATGLLRCEGRVVSLGSRVAMSEARLTDRAGKLYAHATSTCLILRADA